MLIILVESHTNQLEGGLIGMFQRESDGLVV